MLISEDYAMRTGLLSNNRILGEKTGGGIGGPVKRRIVLVRRVEITGVTLNNVEAAIDPAPDALDANVGVSLLRNFDLVIDFPNNEVWFEALSNSNSSP